MLKKIRTTALHGFHVSIAFDEDMAGFANSRDGKGEDTVSLGDAGLLLELTESGVLVELHVRRGLDQRYSWTQK